MNIFELLNFLKENIRIHKYKRDSRAKTSTSNILKYYIVPIYYIFFMNNYSKQSVFITGNVILVF